MQALRSLFDRIEPHVAPGGRYARWYPLYEGLESFCFTPATRTVSGPHVRDVLDLKRMMVLVVVALLPCIVMAMVNTGYQIHRAVDLIAGVDHGHDDARQQRDHDQHHHALEIEHVAHMRTADGACGRCEAEALEAFVQRIPAGIAPAGCHVRLDPVEQGAQGLHQRSLAIVSSRARSAVP